MTGSSSSSASLSSSSVAESSSSYYKENWKYLNQDLEYGELIDERDGQIYKTIEIDGITWMAENLNYSDSNATENLKGQSWCYDNDPSNCAMHGRLYTWYAAMDVPEETLLKDTINHKGICPMSWHIPNNQELYTLTEYYCKTSLSAGGSVGLSVLYSGYYWEKTNFFGFEENEAWFSSHDSTGTDAYIMFFPNMVIHPDLALKPWKHSAMSVRCIKD